MTHAGKRVNDRLTTCGHTCLSLLQSHFWMHLDSDGSCGGMNFTVSHTVIPHGPIYDLGVTGEDASSWAPVEKGHQNLMHLVKGGWNAVHTSLMREKPTGKRQKQLFLFSWSTALLFGWWKHTARGFLAFFSLFSLKKCWKRRQVKDFSNLL